MQEGRNRCRTRTSDSIRAKKLVWTKTYRTPAHDPRKPLLTGWSLVRIRPGEPNKVNNLDPARIDSKAKNSFGAT
jgi:hypothetical protein